VTSAPGDLDTTFAGTGFTRLGFGRGHDQGYAVARQADGKMVVVGKTSGRFTFVEALRYNTDGSLDTTFGGSGTGQTSIFLGSFGGIGYAVRIQTDGKIVIAHNNWTGYMDGSRWTMAFDIKPANGYRFVMDGLPGVIHSADDFGINSAGIVITETTITGFSGYNFNGIPEFIRARKAMQYSASIDDVARIFKDGNNGGYANDWLIADTRRNEIASRSVC